MIHKFKDYNENEQREIVYEIIRQKYMHDPNLNNFQNNTKFITNLIKGLLTDQVSADLVQTKLEELYSKVKSYQYIFPYSSSPSAFHLKGPGSLKSLL